MRRQTPGTRPGGRGAALGVLLVLLACPHRVYSEVLGGYGEWESAYSSAGRPGGRRLLGANTELVQQCEWAPGPSRCVLGADYVSRTVAQSGDPDPVAQYVAASLGCARLKSAAACAASAACAWDGSFADGQEGCLLSDSRHMEIAQQCVQPRYARALGALQACMAQRRGCQCGGGRGSSAAAAASRAGAPCQPLLGCWLARLQGSPFDVLQLAEAQMQVVGPLLATLNPNVSAPAPAAGSSGSRGGAGGNAGSSSGGSNSAASGSGSSSGGTSGSSSSGSGGGAVAATASGSRRRLMQPAGLSGPVEDDSKAPAARKKPAPGPEAAPPPPSPSPTEQASGQNRPILSDGAGGGAAGAGPSGEGGALESASLYDAGIIKAEITAPSAAVTGGNAAATPGGDGEAPAYAPPAFWKCLADAAVATGRGSDWTGIDYTSKKLSLDTWLGAINQLPLLDWGVQALGCFREQAATSRRQGGIGAAPDGQPPESYDLAIASLAKAFAAVRAQFAAHEATAGSASDDARALAALRALHERVLPEALAALATAYNSTAGLTGDAILVARAVLADLSWFSREAAAIGESLGQSAAAYGMFTGHTSTTMRHLLRWAFNKQFGGPRAYVPAPPATTPAGAAAAQALSALAAAHLPAAGVSMSHPRWLQAQSMGAAALLTVASDAAALGNSTGNATQSAAAVVSALGAAHIADLWGPRLGAARAAAAPELLALAVEERGSGSRGWRDAALGAASALGALRQAAAPAAAGGGPSPVLATRIRDGLVQYVAAAATAANPSLPDGMPAAAVAAATRAAALADAARTCGGPPDAAGHAVACERVASESAELLNAALGDLGAGDVIYAAAAEDVSLQWRCVVRPPGSCAALPGCSRGVLALSTAAPVAAAAYPSAVTVAAAAEVGTCGVDDARLSLRAARNATKAALASGEAACASFLALPLCDSLPGGAAGCGAHSACRWVARGSRALVAGAPNGAADGVCASDWEALLKNVSNTERRSALTGAAATCASRPDDGACNALMVALAPPARGSPPSLRTIAPVAAAGAVVGLTVLGIILVFARRHAASRTAGADDDASSDGSGGAFGAIRRRRPSKKNALKRKVKRSEPGEYKPDLMRDSFTDYLTRPAFRTGVAIAAVNMGAGDDGPSTSAGAGPSSSSGGGGGGRYGHVPRGGPRGVHAYRTESSGAGVLLEPTDTFMSGASGPEWYGEDEYEGPPPRRPAYWQHEQGQWRRYSGAGGPGSLIDLGPGSCELGSGDYGLVSKHSWRARQQQRQYPGGSAQQQQQQQQQGEHRLEIAEEGQQQPHQQPLQRVGSAGGAGPSYPHLTPPPPQQQQQQQLLHQQEASGPVSPTASSFHDSVYTVRAPAGATGASFSSSVAAFAGSGPSQSGSSARGDGLRGAAGGRRGGLDGMQEEEAAGSSGGNAESTAAV